MSSLRVDFAAPNISQKYDRVKMRLGDAVSSLVSAAILSLRLMRSTGFLLVEISSTV